ncbi:hypothetical protein F5Y04DRAFT_228061 [Hypomontagnella monticulosa]|nr:hypothetical protein F5Y04DRAFT_228061 [Hypomontagnella monticulosa]
MPPRYTAVDWTLEELIERAGSPPPPEQFGHQFAWESEPTDEFYQYIDRSRAHAIFSTNNGETEFRMPENPKRERDIEVWDATKIQAFGEELRQKHWGRCKYIAQLKVPEDLYIYFDAYDIYRHGAYNLWRVINHLYFENTHYLYESHDENVGRVRVYVQEVLKVAEVAQKLSDWDPKVDSDLLCVFKNGELDGLGQLLTEYNHVVRDTLYNNYLNIRRGHSVNPAFRIGVQSSVAPDAPDNPQVADGKWFFLSVPWRFNFIH